LHETTHLVAAIRFDYSKSACTEHWCSLFQHVTTAGMPLELSINHHSERKWQPSPTLVFKMEQPRQLDAAVQVIVVLYG